MVADRRTRERDRQRRKRCDPVYAAAERCRNRMRARRRRAAARGRDTLICHAIKLSLSGGADLKLLEAMLGNGVAGGAA